MGQLRIRLTLLAVLATMAGGPALAVDIPFSDKQVIGTANGAGAVEVADLDRDGDMDVVAAAIHADSIKVWENTGGGWVEHTIRTGYEQAISVDVGDTDLDGWPDIVACQRGGDGDVLQIKNPDGALGSPWQVRTVWTGEVGCRWIHLADIGDFQPEGYSQYPEILVARFNSSLPDETFLKFYYIDNNSGVWLPRVLYDQDDFSGAHFVTTADMDRDGDLDFVAAAFAEDEVAWFENDSCIHSSPERCTKHTVGTGLDQALAVHAADIDRDGDQDVLGVGYDAGVRLYENQGGTFSETTLPDNLIMDGQYSVATGDLDMNGTQDVLLAPRNASHAWWWEQASNGVFGDATALPTAISGARSVIPADLDGDGDLDVVAALEFDDEVVWWENRRVHHRARYSGYSGSHLLEGADGLASGDVDGDGRVDVVASAYNSTGEADIVVFPGSGPTVTVATNFNGAEDVAVADLNMDGRLDIIAASSRLDSVTWFENTGSGWLAQEIFSLNGAIAVDAGLVNADRAPDVVAAGYLAGEVVLAVNSGGGAPTWEVVRRSVGSGAAAVELADLDGDPFVDVVYGTVGSDTLGWLKKPAFSWGENRIIASGVNITAVHTADVDGDGRTDILSTDSVSNTVSWWRNDNGDPPTFSRVDVATDFDGAWVVRAGDFDDDGDADLAAAGRTSGRLAWWENTDGAGSFVFHDISSGYLTGMRDLTILAAGGDSKLDLIIASDDPDGGWIRTFANNGRQTRIEGWGIAPLFIEPGGSAAVAEFQVINFGTSGDPAATYRHMILNWHSSSTGDPMTSDQVNSLVSTFSLFHESDGVPGVDPGSDALIVATFPIPIDSQGDMFLDLLLSDPNPAVHPNQPETFYIVLDLFNDAGQQEITEFNLWLRPPRMWEEPVTRYRDRDVGLELEYQSVFAHGIRVATPDVLFWDDFETGDASRW